MPTTVNSDPIIYGDLAQTAFLERRQDSLEVFSATLNGAVTPDNGLIEGDFRKRILYKAGGSIEPCNVNPTDPITGKEIGAGESISVRTPWKYSPYETTEGAFKRRGRGISEFSGVVGVDVTDATFEGCIKYALQGLVVAIGINADVMMPASIATDGKKMLTHDLRKCGDKFNRVALFVMHSVIYFDTVDQVTDNKIYEETGVMVHGGQPSTLGKPVLVTDTVPIDAILGLVAGAVSVTESQALGLRPYNINDQENLVISYRVKGTANAKLLGYSQDETKGANPDLAKIDTGANWKKHFASNKPTVGVLIKLEAPTGG